MKKHDSGLIHGSVMVLQETNGVHLGHDWLLSKETLKGEKPDQEDHQELQPGLHGEPEAALDQAAGRCL